MKHIYSLTRMVLSAVLFFVSAVAMADDVTYDLSSAEAAGWADWTSSAKPNGYELTGVNGNDPRGAQFSATATLTLTNTKNVSKVTVICSANTDKNSVALSVGGQSWGTETLPKVYNTAKTFTGSASGNIELTVTRAEKSIYVKTITVTYGEGGGEGGDKDDDDPIVTPPADIEHVTIAEFLNNADPETTYELTGTVRNIKNTTYGNFDLVDETGSIYIYGLLDKEGQAQNFASLGIAEGDEVTLTGAYAVHNDKPEIKNAQFVSLKKDEGGEGGDKDDDDPIVTPPADIEHITIAEFLNNADPETTYELTGTVRNIKNTTYGNFDLVDETGSIYIYGLLDKEGKAQNFASLGIAEGDEVTLTGAYAVHNDKPEIKNAQFVSLKKGEGGEGGGEGGDTDDTELDPNYNYGEPTTVVAVGELGFNKTYTFINNNIKVQTSQGAITDTYFGCNAGQTITFTATKPIKALLVNGYVKQNFEAEASAGEVYYVDASESEVTADPVLAVLDIDNTTVTINCVKQMRCYSVEFYFDENPEIDLGGGGEDDFDTTYKWEPKEATTLNITYDELLAEDYSEYYGFNYTALYLSNDDFEMEIGVFAPMVDGTYIAPGTYQINDTYQPGTVEASPGGDDMYDYPTYIATDFEYVEGDTEEESGWIYNTSYYVVSGTLTVTALEDGVKIVLDAVTYYGTKVHAEYVEGTDEGETSIFKAAAETTVSPRKLLKNGKLLIQTGEHTYDATGRVVK